MKTNWQELEDGEWMVYPPSSNNNGQSYVYFKLGRSYFAWRLVGSEDMLFTRTHTADMPGGWHHVRDPMLILTTLAALAEIKR